MDTKKAEFLLEGWDMQGVHLNKVGGMKVVARRLEEPEKTAAKATWISNGGLVGVTFPAGVPWAVIKAVKCDA